MEKIKNDILDASASSFIDAGIKSQDSLRPQLLYNDTKKGKTVLSCLNTELENCVSFWFSVAFVTEGGLIVLKETLKELDKRGIKGKILTSDYQKFNSPKALRELLKFSNLEVRIYTKKDFHVKGYMFWDNEKYNFIIGSSNLTQKALKATKEWNLKVTSLEAGEVIQQTTAEFKDMWNDADILSEHWISDYEKEYKECKAFRNEEKISRIVTYTLRPNTMQVEATKALDELRKENKKKALLISATGTGKTYLSAFDVRNVAPRKLLFLVHREQILRQAEESFKNVLGEGIHSGIFSGRQKDLDADYLFSTVNMMAREYARFPEEYFEYIIIDETHRAGAESYSKIMEYFKPHFLLGMTATPERMDGFDIYQLFDYNIAYEVRLQKAMEEDILCPFHYFGISEINISGEAITEETEFSHLVSSERVDHILEKTNFYGYSGERVRGLIFCSRKEEARELSRMFNLRGYETIALCGEDSQEVREEAVKKLEQDQREGGLDYIFTVDIMNEGVDVPAINQIIMLRPTQSSIIFIQQLGRGLRKHADKDFVVIIDFIGHYKKNFLIPIALSGDRSYNKDTIRRYVAEGNRLIPGCSTIHFDEISKKRIYQAIDVAQLSEMKLLREEYQNLKYKLGKIPGIKDFEKFGSIDIMKIFDKYGSYHNFLKQYDKVDYHIMLSDKEEEMLNFLTQKVAKGKRVHELELLKKSFIYKDKILSAFKVSMNKRYQIQVTEAEENSIVANLANEFGKQEEQKKYSNCVFLEKMENEYVVADHFLESLKNEEFADMVNEILEYGIGRYEQFYSERYKNTNFQLYQKYTYEDVCRLLNWRKNINAQSIGGYFYDIETKTMPVFINYVKEEGSIAYEDRFVSPSQLIALSKHPRNIQSKDAKHIYEAEKEGNRIYLFVRKRKDDKEAKEFYFLGQISAIGKPHPIIMKDTNDNAFEIAYELQTQVREDIYDYLIN